MELQGENGSTISLNETSEKELGRGPGFAPHDRTVSRRHVRLKLRRLARPEEEGIAEAPGYDLSLEVIGPNPICIIHNDGKVDQVKMVETGKKTMMGVGDKFSLSVREPVFYTLKYPSKRSGSRNLYSSSSTTQTNCMDVRKNTKTELAARNSTNANGGSEVPDTKTEEGNELELVTGIGDSRVPMHEEEGIAEAVARWQRRKQERREHEQQWLHKGNAKEQSSAGASTKEEVDGVERVGDQRGSTGNLPQEELGSLKRLKETDGNAVATETPNQEELSPRSLKANELEVSASLHDIDPVQEFGFLVEGSEFANYDQRRKPDTRDWEWQIGKRVDNGEDDEEGEGSQDNAEIRSKSNIAGTKAKKRVSHAKKDDDNDEWEGESEGERELLTHGKRSTLNKMELRTPSHNSSSASDTVPRRKDEADYGADSVEKEVGMLPKADPGQRLASKLGGQGLKPAQRTSKRNDREEEEEDEYDDGEDEGEDLNGFLVDNVEEVEEVDDDEEEEWRDDGDVEDEVEEDDDNRKEDMEQNIQPAGGQSHGRSKRGAVDSKETTCNKPVCKYGSSCFRKNKDHVAQFQH